MIKGEGSTTPWPTYQKMSSRNRNSCGLLSGHLFPSLTASPVTLMVC
jgi:hypothetical protein